MTSHMAVERPAIDDSRPSRVGWKTFAIGAIVGVAAASAVWGWTARGHHFAENAPPPFAVADDTLKLRPGAAFPTMIETAPAQIGAALPHPAVPARVVTVE